MQKLVLKPAVTQTTNLQLTFNATDLDTLFPGFNTGDFAVIYGGHTVTSLVAQLCVRAQLPTALGGLNSGIIFIDAASSSSLPNIYHAAELQQQDTTAVMEKIKHFRAYTAYRLNSLIMNQLEKFVDAYDAKLVVLSDIAYPFLNENVDDQEARTAYNQIMNYLSNFARKHGIIIIATYLPHESNTRNSTLQETTTAKTGTVLRFTRTPYTSEVELEKHPSYMLGVVDFSPENKTLIDF
jgi:hypothetical protein